MIAAFEKGYYDGNQTHVYNNPYDEGTEKAEAYHAGYDLGTLDWSVKFNALKPKEVKNV